jgi:putative heme-binding domain-containing protein
MRAALLALLAAQAVGPDDAVKKLLDASLSMTEREAAVKSLAQTQEGAASLLTLADQGRLPEELRATASFSLAGSPDAGVRALGEKKLPVPKTKDGRVVPAISELLSKTGDAKAGERVFRDPKGANCIGCHELGAEGKLVGPPLTTIATKLSKEQLYESVLTPSAGILMSYENWAVRTKDGDVKTGIKVEETDERITLKDSQGEYIDIPLSRIDQKKQSKMSMMPDNLVSAMTLDELVNLVEFLTRQK